MDGQAVRCKRSSDRSFSLTGQQIADFLSIVVILSVHARCFRQC